MKPLISPDVIFACLVAVRTCLSVNFESRAIKNGIRQQNVYNQLAALIGFHFDQSRSCWNLKCIKGIDLHFKTAMFAVYDRSLRRYASFFEGISIGCLRG